MSSLIRKPFSYSFKNATVIIILVNLGVYLLEKIFPPSISILSLNVINCIGHKMFWQPFTYMFVHGNFQHIFFNMFGLFIFGMNVERAIGTKEFCLMYFVTGFLCGLLSLVVYFISGNYGIFLMGASGAIYGILLAYAVIFPRNRIFIWGIIPIPAPVLVIVYAVIETVSQVFGVQNGVAHSVHLAGFLFTFLYFIVRMGINPIKVWKNAYR